MGRRWPPRRAGRFPPPQTWSRTSLWFAPLIWLGRAVSITPRWADRRCGGRAGTLGRAPRGRPHSGRGRGRGDGTRTTGGADSLQDGSSARPQAAASPWTMVERTPKPGGGDPACRATRPGAGRRCADGFLARTSVDCVTVGAPHGARRARPEQDLGQIRRLRAARAAVDHRHEGDDRVPGLVARERDRHVVQAGRSGEGEAQRGPRPARRGVAHLGDGDVELGRRGHPDLVGPGRGGGCGGEERGGRDSADATRDITATH